MVEIPVEIATFRIINSVLSKVLDHLVITAVTAPINTEVILAVIKLLVTTTRITAILVIAILVTAILVTAILVTAILVTAMLYQVKNVMSSSLGR